MIFSEKILNTFEGLWSVVIAFHTLAFDILGLDRYIIGDAYLNIITFDALAFNDLDRNKLSSNS